MLKTQILCLGLLACLQIHLSTCDVHLFVSPNGSDHNDGLSDQMPVKSLLAALALADRKPRNETVYIELMQGFHDLDRTVNVRRSHTVIRSYKSQEVHVTGGRRIPSSFIKPVTDQNILSRLPANARSHVRVVNLHDLNITDIGKMEPYGSNVRRNSPLEVFFNGQPLRMAQWPNEGFLDVTEVPDGLNGLRFRYNSTVPQSWHHEQDPWVYGYWYAGWTDGAVKVASFDSTTMTVSLAQKPPHGIRIGHLQEWLKGASKPDGGIFRFINIFSELDQPGEYYVDRDTGNMYMWMPNGDGHVKSSDVLYVSMIGDCMWVTRTDIRLEDFTLEFCRKHGIFVLNGVDQIKLHKLEIANTGQYGVQLGGDTREIEISQCYVHDTCGGIIVSGGERKTLESSGNIIENNEIVRFDRVGSVGNEAVSMWGVGHVLRNNHIYDGRIGAVFFNGNDMLMENNLVHHVCKGTSSCNAFRIGYDWTYRGNVIQNNIIHNVLQLFPGGSNRAILLDAQGSGTTIRYNAFVNNTCHVYIAGGRDNEIINNVMYNATDVCLHVDNRGIHNHDNRIIQRLHAMPYTNPTWSMRYPKLADIDNHNASLPEGNQIIKNLIYMHPASPNSAYIKGAPTAVMANSSFFNFSQIGFSAGSVDHYSVKDGDLRLKCNAYKWANQVDFQQPPKPNSVGPLLSPIGPNYLNRGRLHLVNTTYPSSPCSTNPPPEEFPVSSYLPDGSPDNHVYPVESEGCWLNVTRCTNHKASVGTYRDMYGERYRQAAENETMCFRQALEQWEFCGSHENEWVVAIYGPTGSATLGGANCMIATYGCPKHGGPADGHRNTSHGWYQKVGQGKPGEEGCLVRSRDIWNWCGANPNYPVTSIYLPTGAKRTAGGGCWIQLEKCPADRQVNRIFYDAVGATNYHTDVFEFACLHRAEYFWKHCGSNPEYPVTATYRPTTVSMTYP